MEIHAGTHSVNQGQGLEETAEIAMNSVIWPVQEMNRKTDEGSKEQGLLGSVNALKCLSKEIAERHLTKVFPSM